MQRQRLGWWLVALLSVGVWVACDDAAVNVKPKDTHDTAPPEEVDETDVSPDLPEADVPAEVDPEIDPGDVLPETEEIEVMPDVAPDMPQDVPVDQDTGPRPPQLGEACTAATLCAEGLVCAAGICVRGGASCAEDAQCQGDSYCCLSGCEPQGQCIPYGTGPRGNVDDTCTIEVVPGLFEARIQCEWTAPPPGDPFPDHVQVLTTPLVANLPNHSGHAAEIIIVTYNFTDGGAQAAAGTDARYFGVIRILNGETCEQLETIDDPEHRIIAASPPAIADLDADGMMEIVAQRAGSGLVAFKWDVNEQRFKRYWVATETGYSGVNRWDGPAIHDLDDDGFPEVISGSEVFDGRTGARLNPGQIVPGAASNSASGRLSVVADVDGDGHAELLGQGVWRWNRGSKLWELAYPGSPTARHYGYADFGTPGATPGDFDFTTLDGIAEVVVSGDNRVGIYTLGGQQVFYVSGLSTGGPPTIGDFDNDGFPEIAVADGIFLYVFDPDCTAAGPDCYGPNIRWRQSSQDSSSATTGLSIFDFEGDGQAEVVYADECFTRIYDGMTGEVHFSAYRTSCTWYENAIIADPDRDDNAEILVGSNTNCSISCPLIDPIHRGLRCENDGACPSGQCDAGYCRCSDHDQCGSGYQCVAPLAGTPGSGQVCRAYRPPGAAQTGLRVMRDRLDRWVSSRPLWNQHVYTVTNINDNGTVPRTSAWKANFREPGLNNFRQNVQGPTGRDQAPDITGRFNEGRVCEFTSEGIFLVAQVCNRGAKAVGAAMPATFYLGEPELGNILCVSYTSGPVPVGGCMEVSCDVGFSVSGEVVMVVNDDGAGGQTTIECNSDNNTDRTNLQLCLPN